MAGSIDPGWRSLSGAAALLVVFTIGAAGCGRSSNIEFAMIDLVPVQEELSELSLGSYSIPIPIIVDQTADRPQRENRLEFDFQLHALVPRQQMQQLEEAWRRQQGQLRDRVIRVCRNASLDDLQEPELATLKSHLTDVIQAQLGEREIRQLLITEVVSQEL